MRLIPRLKPAFDWREIIAALTPSKDSISRYERQFAEKFGCQYGVMFPYGRSALYSLFKIWGLRNDEIICPAYTCVVVSHAIVMSSNIPVFVDCDRESFNMSYEGIRKAITGKTRAVLVTHLFGYPMDVHKVAEIVAEAERTYGHKIYIIQDAGHSFGARWQGELVTKFGDASVFGLSISKIVSSVFGGMAITNDKDTYDNLVRYRSENFVKQGMIRDIKCFIYFLAVVCAFNQYVYVLVNWLERKGFLDRFVKYYDEHKVDLVKDWNHYPSQLEARVGLVQLRKYDAVLRERVRSAEHYIRRFRSDPSVRILPLVDGATYSHCVALVEDRGEWVRNYRRKRIQLGTLIDYVIPYMPVYEKYRRVECPVSKYYSQHTINFPNWPGVDRMRAVAALLEN